MDRDVGDRVAGELERDEDRGDEPEVAADEMEAAGEAGADAAPLDLDDRRGEAEVDVEEDPRQDEGGEADGDEQRRRAGRPRSAAGS